MAIVTLGTKLPSSPPPALYGAVPYYQWTIPPAVLIRTPDPGFLTNIGIWARFVSNTWRVQLGVYAVANGVPTTLLARTGNIEPVGQANGSFGANMEATLDWVNVAAAPGSVQKAGAVPAKLYLPADTPIMLAWYIVGSGLSQTMEYGSSDTVTTRQWFQLFNTTGLLANPNGYTTVSAARYPGLYATMETAVPPTAALTTPLNAAVTIETTPTFSGTFATTDSSDSFAAYQVEVWLDAGTAPLRDSGVRTATSSQVTSKTWQYTYDGPALVDGTAYKWRARVQATAGGWSAYTAFRTFSRPAPTGGIDLATGAVPAQNAKIDQPQTMSWAARWYHTTTEGMSGAQIQIRNPDGSVVATSSLIAKTVAAPAPAAPPGTLFTISQAEAAAAGLATATLQAGRTYHAYLRGRSATSLVLSDYAGPLVFRTNALAGTPVPVTPADDAVFSTRPELVVRGYDPDPEDVPGTDTIWRFEIQQVATGTLVRTAASAYVAAADPALSEARLQLTATEVPTFGDYRWRARSEEAAAGTAGISPFTDWRDFRYSEGAAVAITAPLPDEQVPVGVVRIAWTNSEPQKFYQVQVFQQADNVRRYVTTVITSPNLYHDIPLGELAPNVPYYARVSVWNLSSVQSTSADVRFTVVPGAIVALQNVALQVQAMSGDVEATTPVISWARSAQPEARFRSYLVRRYVTAEGRATAALVGQVTNFAQLSLRDYHAPPGVSLTYLVSQQGQVDSGAITESVATSLATSVTITTPVIVSLGNPATDRFPLRHQQGGPPARKLKPRKNAFQTWGAAGLPTVIKAPGAQATRAAKFTVISDAYGSADDKIARIEATIAAGALVSYRVGRDRLFMDLADNDIVPGDSPGQWDVTLSLEQTAYREDRG